MYNISDLYRESIRLEEEINNLEVLDTDKNIDELRNVALIRLKDDLFKVRREIRNYKGRT